MEDTVPGPEGAEIVPPQGNIVLADDEELILTLLSKLFPRFAPGKTVHALKDAESAMTAIDLITADLKQELSLIVSDGSMPPSNIHGLKFYQQVREKGLSEVPFILQTGDHVTKDELDESGASTDPLFKLLQKPVSLSALKETVNALLAVRAEIEKTGWQD